jgi:hypothetical protein
MNLLNMKMVKEVSSEIKDNLEKNFRLKTDEVEEKLRILQNEKLHGYADKGGGTL